MTWPTKKLNEICDLQNGFAFKSTDYVSFSNTLNIRMSNIRVGGYFDPEHNIKFLPDSYVNKYKDFLLKDGDLIIAMTDMASDPKILGVPTLVKNIGVKNFLLNQRVGKLCNFSDEIFVPFLCYFLKSANITKFYKSKGGGGLQINISKNDILAAEIPLPSLEIQKKIVDKIEKLFAKIDEAQKLREEAKKETKSLLQSTLNEIFKEGKLKNWKIRKISDKCIIKMTSGGTPSRGNLKFYNGKIIWLKSGELNDNENIIDSEEHITEEAIINSSAKIFPAKTVLFAMYGATAGKLGILGVSASTNQAVAGLLCNEKNLDYKFLFYVLKNIRENIILKAWGGAQPNLSQTIIKDFEFPLPAIEEQKKIVSKLDGLTEKVRELEKLQGETATDMVNLKQSILNQAFNGELIM